MCLDQKYLIIPIEKKALCNTIKNHYIEIFLRPYKRLHVYSIP